MEQPVIRHYKINRRKVQRSRGPLLGRNEPAPLKRRVDVHQYLQHIRGDSYYSTYSSTSLAATEE